MEREQLVELLRKTKLDSKISVVIGLMNNPVELRPSPFTGVPMTAHTRKLSGPDIVAEFQQEIRSDLTRLPDTIAKYGIFIYEILGKNLVRYAKITQDNK